MIRTIYRSSKGGITTDVPESKWKVALLDSGGLFWADLAGEPGGRVEQLLADLFHFHPLAIDDALQEAHVPKIDDWGEYVYAVVHGVSYNPATNELDTNEIDVFLGKNFLITHHKNPVMSADKVWAASQRSERYLARGADYLLYNIVDTLVSDFMPVVDQLDDAIDELEDQIFAAGNQAVLTKIFAIKRAVLHLRRIIIPQREVFRDVYDHLVRLADINDTLRDLTSGALDTYLSVSSNRINEIMKVLTVFTALCMPLTFLTGFFGMNFETLPFQSPYLFIGMLPLTIVIPLAMWRLFRRQGWI
ncbi:MAG: magnesium transporter CorA family protein [Chloroflexi bacterium]|nr:magnesium transporter CorA family protein [Chloroflexota bacterium]